MICWFPWMSQAPGVAQLKCWLLEPCWNCWWNWASRLLRSLWADTGNWDRVSTNPEVWASATPVNPGCPWTCWTGCCLNCCCCWNCCCCCCCCWKGCCCCWKGCCCRKGSCCWNGCCARNCCCWNCCCWNGWRSNCCPNGCWNGSCCPNGSCCWNGSCSWNGCRGNCCCWNGEKPLPNGICCCGSASRFLRPDETWNW